MEGKCGHPAMWVKWSDCILHHQVYVKIGNKRTWYQRDINNMTGPVRKPETYISQEALQDLYANTEWVPGLWMWMHLSSVPSQCRGRSRKTVFLNMWKPEQRYKVLQFDKTSHATRYCTNIFKLYEKCPAEHPEYDFKNMSLIEF